MELFWKTEQWLEYLLNSKFGMVYKDHSFFMGNKFIPLVQDGEEFYSPGFDDDKKILLYVKELAQQHNIKRIQVNSQIKSYLNISGYTCILNPFEINLSKGHKSAIKKSKQYLSCERIYTTNQFMKDYYEIAGKVTRPKKTFEIIENWINKGYGFLLKATYQGKTAGYAYILTYKNWAYYFMGCTFPEYKEYNVSHFLQDSAFFLLRFLDIKYYEMGEQVYNSLTCQPSVKERNISLFKRGFSSNIIVNPVSEYFFDEQYFKQAMLNRTNKYWEREHEQNINSVFKT